MEKIRRLKENVQWSLVEGACRYRHHPVSSDEGDLWEMNLLSVSILDRDTSVLTDGNRNSPTPSLAEHSFD